MIKDQENEPYFPNPSEFMRERKPYLYSDSSSETSFHLDRTVFSHFLETLTQRNEHQDFELFCRKLCEREICPNLRPQTGPEGGGDGKVDTETYPVAEEISNLWYIGETGAAKERWAFAFSAKQKWSPKVRSDVEGIINENRGYQRIFFITSRPVRNRDKLRIEDELTSKYDVPVTIHDQSWIIERVFENKHFALAYEYLNIGDQLSDKRILGPNDLVNQSELDELENLLNDPEAYLGLEHQQARDALIAAKISRNLELPRFETDGRFMRAMRLAEKVGFRRTSLEATYEYAWTLYWWFDDFLGASNAYDAVENLAINSPDTIDLDKMLNLLTVLSASVNQGHISEENAKLNERFAKLFDALDILSKDPNRPTNALQAETNIILMNLQVGRLNHDSEKISSGWKELEAVIQKALKLPEYPMQKPILMISQLAEVIGDDPAFEQLFETVAEIAGERESDGKSGMLLLSRAKKKLDLEQPLQALGYLGRAALKLMKHEYRDHQVEAQYLISVGYRSAGLMWSARSACLNALMHIFADAGESNEFRPQVMPAIKLWAWISLELGHIPDTLAALEMFRIFSNTLPLDDESKEYAESEYFILDGCLGCLLSNSNEEELPKLSELPDILGAIDLIASQGALLYRMGYEDFLRTEGFFPAKGTEDFDPYEFYSSLAAQPAKDQTPRMLLTFFDDTVVMKTKVLGVNVECHVENTDNVVAFAEFLLSGFEAFLATALNSEVYPLTSRSIVHIIEDETIDKPKYQIEEISFNATISWPSKLKIFDADATETLQTFVYEFILFFAHNILAMANSEQLIKELVENDLAPERALSFSPPALNYSRILRRSRSLISDWKKHIKNQYTVKDERPVFNVDFTIKNEETTISPQANDNEIVFNRHDQIKLQSFGNPRLWDKAEWSGVAYAVRPDNVPPLMGMRFEDYVTAKKIFAELYEKHGSQTSDSSFRITIVKGISRQNPTHYRVCISPEPNKNDLGTQGTFMMGRTNTMEPISTENLDRFLEDYEKKGAYIFALIEDFSSTSVKIVNEFAMIRRKLVVTEAWQINLYSPDVFAIRRDDDPFIPSHVKNAPVQDVLAQLRQINQN
ncbi:MAG: hypothetical protein HWE30_03625 [Methylocystaceae bacterium]|nr:hypothetical protein [Methylocystaceae bacterium]